MQVPCAHVALHGWDELIPEPAHVQKLRCSWAEKFVAQSTQIRVDRARAAHAAVAPHLVRELIAADDRTGVARQIGEQLELGRCEIDDSTAQLYAPGGQVNRQLADLQLASRI